MDTRAFLNNIQWLQSPELLTNIEDDFIRHMEDGLAGKPSSLPMIPTYLRVGDIPQGENTVIVLDAGGTNLRAFLVKIRPGEGTEILYSNKCPMPGKAEPLSREDFFDAIAKEVLPIANYSDRIGFCFSFPCVIHPDYDGEILYLDKEITVHDIEGAMVGVELNKALRRLGCHDEHRVIVLNDTVAALLGTLARHPSSDYSGFIGMILGTGMNCCYQEENAKILKNDLLRGLPGGSIINMEAGSYHGAFTMSKADHALSRFAKEAGQNITEKMISGAYQGALMHSLLYCAVEDGLFSPAFREKFRSMQQIIDTPDVSNYASVPAAKGVLHDLCACEEDARLMWSLSDALLERAAMLTAAMLTAIMRHTGAGTNPIYPVMITIEGTTYSLEVRLRQKIKNYLLHHTEKQLGIYCRIYKTPDANMVGAATAAILAE